MICALCAGRKLELEPGQRLELCFAHALERARQAYEEPLGESATARQRAPSELRWSQAQRRERLEEAAASRPGASYGSV